MNDDPCMVSVNGRDYYVACNVLEYIVKDGSDLINTSNSSITLFAEYPELNNSSSGYPRISASANQKFYYRSSYSGSNVTLSVDSYKVLNRHTSNDFLLSVVILGVLILNLFKR